MKKTIEFKVVDSQFQLYCDSEVVITIPKDNLTIDGKQLFDKFVSKLDLSTQLELDYIDDSTIVDANGKRIINDIKLIFDNIVKKINKKFKLQAEAADNPLDNVPEESIDTEDISVEEDLPF